MVEETIKKMEETKNGCDHKCDTCEMFLPARDECFHIANKKWEEWNRQKHERFEKLLRGEE